MVLEVTREKVRASWYHFARVDLTDEDEIFAGAYATFDGTNRIVAD